MIRYNFIVVVHSDNFCMACLTCAYGLVCRIWNFASSIATLNFLDPLEPLQDSLNAPEAPAPNDSLADHFWFANNKLDKTV